MAYTDNPTHAAHAQQLLPQHHRTNGSSPSPHWTARLFRRWVVLAVVVTVLAVTVLVYQPTLDWDLKTLSALAAKNSAACSLPTNSTSATKLPANQDIIDLFARQSKTLEQAIARYTLKTGRTPPPNFDKWFEFATEGHCLIDDYDRIDANFEPFYRVADERPGYFRDMVQRGHEFMREDARGMSFYMLRNGTVQFPGDVWGTPWDADLQVIINNFGFLLPDMEFLLNGRDEPRVAFNSRMPHALRDAAELDVTAAVAGAFRITPRPTTAQFFRDRVGCDVSQTAAGYVRDPVDDIAFFASTSTSEFSTDLWPVLSMSTITPCFSDIVYPNAYFYDSSPWSGKFAFPDSTPWEAKDPILYWRGASNGGHFYATNYRSFPRFRLIDIARAHPDLVDARITDFAANHCTEECDGDRIVEEYGITGEKSEREDVYGYRYVLDVDGNAFSGRFLGLLRSGSLVFKSTVFQEYFSDWLRPYEHFIPVRPDLSDLLDKIEWARANDAEARRIQEAGMRVAREVITDRQNDCFFARVLLEWARLQSMGVGVEATE